MLKYGLLVVLSVGLLEQEPFRQAKEAHENDCAAAAAVMWSKCTEESQNRITNSEELSKLKLDAILMKKAIKKHATFHRPN